MNFNNAYRNIITIYLVYLQSGGLRLEENDTQKSDEEENYYKSIYKYYEKRDYECDKEIENSYDY